MLLLNLLNNYKVKLFGYGKIENVNKTNYSKNCLLLYIITPFRRKSLSNIHQNQWQVKELAKIIGEYKYNVDVIQFTDNKVKLNKMYDLIIDLHPGLNNIYKTSMNLNCIKIAYITGSNPSFSNMIEEKRILDLFERRGAKVRARRFVKPFEKKEFESFHAMFFIGNSYNLKTYKEFKIPKVLFIKNSGYALLEKIDFSYKSPSNFLFFTSSGQVYKGLDLILEVFVKNQHLKLYICSNFKSEKDFCKIYKTELYKSPNIFPIGFVRTNSNKFQEIIKVCSFMILPSSAEANAGSVLTVMSAGVIPIISRECGFEENEVYYFSENTIECIERTINSFALMPFEWIKTESNRILQIVKTKYSCESYSKSIKEAFSTLFSQ